MPLSNFPNGITVDDIATIDENGLLLEKYVWKDLRIPVTSTKLGGTKDPDFAKVIDNGDGSQGLFLYLFDNNTEEEVYFARQLPHEWVPETSIYSHAHWFPVANGTAGQKVCWGLEYSIQKIGGIFSNSIIIYGDTSYPTVTSLVAKTHYVNVIGSAISMTGIDTTSPMIVGRAFRDATGAGGTDDFADDAALLEIDFHYLAYRLGSNTQFE